VRIVGTRTQCRTIAGFGFDANPVVSGGSNSLLAAEVSLGRLNRYVPNEELNLFQFAALSITQPGTCPSAIVRRDLLDARLRDVLADDLPDCLSVKPSPRAVPFLFPPKQPAGVQFGGLEPFIEYYLDRLRPFRRQPIPHSYAGSVNPSYTGGLGLNSAARNRTGEPRLQMDATTEQDTLAEFVNGVSVPSLSVDRTEAVHNRRLRLVQVRQPQHCFGNASVPLSRSLHSHRRGLS
jgi:hypothetical protein